MKTRFVKVELSNLKVPDNAFSQLIKVVQDTSLNKGEALLTLDGHLILSVEDFSLYATKALYRKETDDSKRY